MIDLPQKIRQLIGRCEIGENTFDNDDLSLALKFGELLWNRLEKMSDHYERQSDKYDSHSIRGFYLSQSARDMRHVLNDTAKDIGTEEKP